MQFEPYDNTVKSSKPDPRLIFELASHEHLMQILKISQEHESSDLQKAKDRFVHEIDINSTDKPHRLFVALNESGVLGFCRYFHSDLLAQNKILYSSPTGFYNMGITIKKTARRQGIGTFLSLNREKHLIREGVKTIYSGVSAQNLSSIRFHKKQLFTPTKDTPGFLHVSFDCKSGILFKKNLNTLNT
ncbi:MAG: GNAT family N-acetyltransferase [Bdellovibrionales bacterium]